MHSNELIRDIERNMLEIEEKLKETQNQGNQRALAEKWRWYETCLIKLRKITAMGLLCLVVFFSGCKSLLVREDTNQGNRTVQRKWSVRTQTTEQISNKIVKINERIFHLQNKKARIGHNQQITVY